MRRAGPRFGLSGALVPCLLLAGVGCDSAPEPAPEPVKLWQANTARGPVTLPYREVGGWAIADDDIVLGRVDQVRPRDFHKNGVSWPNGIIPYVWDISFEPTEQCSVDKQKLCEAEWEYLTQGDGPNGIPIWEEFKQHVAAESSLSLVDATACYYDETCNAYLEPGSFIFVRRPAPRTADDNQDTCEAVNNTRKQLTTYTLADIPGESWDLDIAGSAWTIPGTGLGAADAQAIVDAVTSDPDYDDLPVTAELDGATVKFQAKLPVDVTIALTGATAIEPKYEKGGNSSCVGATGCENDDCDPGFRCVDVWPYHHTQYSVANAGYCQYTGGLSSLGPPALGETTERFLGIPTAWYHTSSFRSMAHELMHVAGFIHEHQRPDNYDQVFVVGDPACKRFDDATDLNKDTTYDLMGWASPLDWASRMMYGSNNMCKSTPECKDMCLNAVADACPDTICSPNPSLPGYDVIRHAGWIEGYDRLGKPIDDGELGFSYKDQDALRMYAGNAFAQAFVEGQCPWYPDDGDMLPEFAYAGSETRDGFASALAIGRFGDEDSGVLVGIPDEEEDYFDIKTGAATVWESNRYALELPVDALSWETDNPHLPAIPILARDQFMVPQDFADDFPQIEAGDRFGFALAAVDFNGDGIDEIAVGAPRAGAHNSGLVYLYHTSDAKKKHRPWQVLAPPTDVDAWEFGYALATGNFAGKDNDDTCVSRHRQELAVGSPKMIDASGNRSGAVYVYRWNSDTKAFEPPRAIPASVSENNQRFGHALAAADLDGDHRDGLVVGAPMFGAGDTGRVYVYESDTPTSACDMQLAYKGGRIGAHTGGRLGSAIAAGDFLRGTGDIFSPDDVAVGAPRPGNVGYVELFKGTGAPLAVNTTFTPLTTLKQVANGLDNDEVGDEFGYALAVTEYSYVVNPGSKPRPAYLYIGAPSEKNADSIQTGAVYQVEFTYETAQAGTAFRGDRRDTEDCPADQAFGCDLHVVEPELAGRFGAAIAASRRILVIGDPSFDLPDGGSEISDVGAARIYVRQRDPLADDGWYLMRWFTESNEWPTPVGGFLPP